MARRATLLEQIKKDADFFLAVDAGGFSGGMGEEARLKADYLLTGLEWLGYKVLNLGVRDMMNGGQFLKTLDNKHDISLISGNIQYKNSGKNFVKPYEILEVRAQSKESPFDEIKVGVVGLCDERGALFSSNLQEEQLESADPVEKAREIIQDISGKSDLIILLYHGKFSVAEQIAREVNGIDVLVMGGEYYRAERSSIQKPIVVSSPSMGKYLGLLRLTLDQDKNIVNKIVSKTPLDEDVEDTEKFVTLAAEYEKKAQEIRQARLAKQNNK